LLLLLDLVDVVLSLASLCLVIDPVFSFKRYVGRRGLV
jgi:hypothetical protein